MADKSPDSYYIHEWKKEMRQIIRLKHPDLKKEKIEAFLDKKVKEKLRNRGCDLVNNYNKKSFSTNVLSVVELIHKNDLIIGGAGCLFIQHDQKYNPIADYIMDIMKKRKSHKNDRKKYEKGSYEWKYHDLMQLMFKIKINSLYGVMGYKGFPLFNIFLAEATTNYGQNIISSATQGFENFLSDNSEIFHIDELYVYMNNIIREAKNYPDEICDPFEDIDPEDVIRRILKKCKFQLTKTEVATISGIIYNCNRKTRLLLYYKNNMDAFLETPLMKTKCAFIMNSIGTLLIPEVDEIEDKNCVEMIEDVWKFIEVFVFYNYPVGDRIRKTKYCNRKSVLYIDTDSNMLSVDKFVRYFRKLVLPGDTRSERDITYTGVNLTALYMSRAIAKILKNMTDNMNISDEWAAKLLMKNEFYFSRMLFTTSKKRYLAQMILQEGSVLNGGAGYPEIKGFDFIKAGTKESVKNTYVDICLNDILNGKISPPKIFAKVMKFKKEIERSLYNGETIYYKQANVGIIEKYADPYRIPGIKGTLLWNLLCPENMIELPMDVDLVPIKSITEDKKFRKDFAERYPDIYDKIVDEFGVLDEKGRQDFKFDLNVIAKPKNVLDLPDWYQYMIDTDKITMDAIGLILPILGSLGLKTLEVSNGKEIASNLVSI